MGSKTQRSRTFNWHELNLSKIDAPELDTPFTKEILHAIQQQPADKASGPDGFIAAFYKRCWPIIKNDLALTLNSFYNLQTGPLEKLNTASVVLLPKKKKPPPQSRILDP